MKTIVRFATLFLCLYAVTVLLFWYETGCIITGLGYGVIAAALKTCVTTGHRKIFEKWIDKQD